MLHNSSFSCNLQAHFKIVHLLDETVSQKFSKTMFLAKVYNLFMVFFPLFLIFTQLAMKIIY